MVRHIHKYGITVYISICVLFLAGLHMCSLFFMASGHPRFWPVATSAWTKLISFVVKRGAETHRPIPNSRCSKELNGLLGSRVYTGWPPKAPVATWQLEREPKVEQGKIREVRKYRNVKRLFVQSWTEHKVAICRDNKNEHDESDDSNNDNDCNDGMARNDVNMTLMLVILDAHGCRQCLVAPHSGIDSFVSKIMLEPHFGRALHLPLAESYTCKWNWMLCFGWCELLWCWSWRNDSL